MQVNSAQDYLTMRKRQIVAKSYYSTPPPQEQKTNSVWLSTVGNNATTRQRFVASSPSGWGSVPGTATFSNWCTGCSVATGAPGTFQTVNRKDIMSMQALRPIGVRATSVIA